MRIAVIEDDQTVCEMLRIYLEHEGYEALFYHDGLSAMNMLHAKKPDLILLDWMLPGKDGITLLKEIRQVSHVPIIMLTAKDTDAEQVIGLENGADDYVTKPFSPFTLLARIKALLRRTWEQKNEPSHLLKGTHYMINTNTHEVILHEQVIDHLTVKEFQLLSFLAKYPKHVFSREQLIENVWGYDFIGDERTVDAHIKRLRKKIHTPPFSWIHTVWGIGYKFDEDTLDEK